MAALAAILGKPCLGEKARAVAVGWVASKHSTLQYLLPMFPPITPHLLNRRMPSMTDRKIKWLMYTVLVGLIPVLCRLLIWVISQDRNIDLLNATDFVVFGLILHISNINAIEQFDDSQEAWKTAQNGTSILFIVLYSVLFASSLLDQANPGLVDTMYVTYISISLSIVSFLLCFSVYFRSAQLTER